MCMSVSPAEDGMEDGTEERDEARERLLSFPVEGGQVVLELSGLFAGVEGSWFVGDLLGSLGSGGGGWGWW